MKYTLGLAFLFIFLTSAQNVNQQDGNVNLDTVKVQVYKLSIKENIAQPVWRITQRSIDSAIANNADYILIHMNTYGGLVNIADSIRTVLLNCPIPILVFIDNNAASAGALIAISADSIYMRPGASIGAATVVDAQGQVVPDKYQSYMRATMRATAESHGKDTVISGQDTIISWHRDPKIAEAMVDPSVYIEGIIDTGKVLTFTTLEAIKYGFCEGQAEDIQGVLELAGIEDYEILEYKLSTVDKIIGLLISPMISGLLIMVIVGGIYFELQSPGIGFPLGAAVLAAILYFAPLYLEGMAQNWELLIFIIGFILIAVEVFAIPGFGVAGISGVLLVVGGLTLAMIDNVVFEYEFEIAFSTVIKAFFIVVTSSFLAFILSLYLGKKLFTSTSKTFSQFSLQTNLQSEDGYIGVDEGYKDLVGRIGIAESVLRPSGKVIIDDEIYDAKSEFTFINKGEKVKVLRFETGQLYVVQVKEELN